MPDLLSRRAEFLSMQPVKSNGCDKILSATYFDTRIGPMLVIADDHAIYLLEFADRSNLERKVERLKLQTKTTIIQGITNPIKSIIFELESYFVGTLIEFKTPLHLLGTPFQKLAWTELMRIPYGQTTNYAMQAEAIEKRGSYRAVANANGANQLVIVIPCHRIINSNGKLGGYNGGIARKKWLIDHEKRNTQ